MIEPVNVQNRFSSADLCRFVSHARICNFFIILNTHCVGKYGVPGSDSHTPIVFLTLSQVFHNYRLRYGPNIRFCHGVNKSIDAVS